MRGMVTLAGTLILVGLVTPFLKVAGLLLGMLTGVVVRLTSLPPARGWRKTERVAAGEESVPLLMSVTLTVPEAEVPVMMAPEILGSLVIEGTMSKVLRTRTPEVVEVLAWEGSETVVVMV